MFKKKMQEEIDKLKNKARLDKKENKRLFLKLKKMKGAFLDKKFLSLHIETFREINCMDCANCCKTSSPIFIQKDINRIAKYLRMKTNSFYDKYLKRDEDFDVVLQKSPCIFLSADNACSIYEVRPKACREYPHTDRKKMNRILPLTMKNIEICPAVSRIVDKMK